MLRRGLTAPFQKVLRVTQFMDDLELATVRLQVLRATVALPPLHISLQWYAQIYAPVLPPGGKELLGIYKRAHLCGAAGCFVGEPLRWATAVKF